MDKNSDITISSDALQQILDRLDRLEQMAAIKPIDIIDDPDLEKRLADAEKEISNADDELAEELTDAAEKYDLELTELEMNTSAQESATA